MGLAREVMIDGVRYLPACQAAPTMEDIKAGLVALYWGPNPGRGADLEEHADGLRVRVMDDGDGETLDDALASIREQMFLESQAAPEVCRSLPAAEQAVGGVRDPIEAAHERVSAELKHEREVRIAKAEQAVVEAAMEEHAAEENYAAASESLAEDPDAIPDETWTAICSRLTAANTARADACAALAKLRQGEGA